MIKIKTPEEIEVMRQGGRILADIMEALGKEIKPGITTKDLDRLAESLILSSGGKCSFKNYSVPDGNSPEKKYPSCLCTSINEEIVHAIPSDRTLKEGDIISLDIGMEYEGFHTDMAATFPVGDVEEKARKIMKVTEKALVLGIEKIKPGNHIGDIGHIIQKYVESQGFGVVRELCGHGIGRDVHEDPEILNSVSFDKITVDKVDYIGDAKIEIKPGMVLCVEPMVTVGDWHIKKSKDGFGFVTKDGSLACHFEHTIASTQDGSTILTVKQ